MSEDVIYLRNDEQRRGQVMITSLGVSTPYGELSIAADRCARVAFFEDEEDKEIVVEVIITVNGNRITGTNTEPIIRFRDGSSGEETEVEKKDIWFITFRQDSDELSFLDAGALPDQFIMSNGDLLTDFDYRAFLSEHCESGAPLSVGTYHKKVQISLGVFELDAGRRIKGFREKPTLSLPCSMGIYALDPAVLEWIPRNRHFGFRVARYLRIH